MSENSSEIATSEVDKLINELFLCSVKMIGINEDKYKKEQVTPILKSIILAKNKEEIKKNLKLFIGKLKEFGMTVYNEHSGSETDVPILWSNGRPENVFEDSIYNKGVRHYEDINSTIFYNVLWKIMPIIINPYERNSQIKFDKSKMEEETRDTYCFKMRELSTNFNKTDSHILHDRLLSELWVEEMPIDIILKGGIRVEFGQNDPNRKRRDVFSTTDSVMSVSELPILLDRVAQYNVDMDLAGTPDKKIYLENIGVSEDEIISGNYKSIKERYGKDRDNPNAGYILLKKAERDSKGEISKESVRIPIQLRLMILDLGKQRLKEIKRRVDKVEEITTERVREENQKISNSFNDEEKQHIFIEKLRQKQEKNFREPERLSFLDIFKKKETRKYKNVIEQQKQMIQKKEQKVSSHLEALLRKIDENEISAENSHSIAG